MAFSKMLGFDVTPLSPSSSIRRRRIPSSSNCRLMLSSQIDWPSASMSRSGLLIFMAPIVGYFSEVSYPDEPAVICPLSARHAISSVLRSRPSRRR